VRWCFSLPEGRQLPLVEATDAQAAGARAEAASHLREAPEAEAGETGEAPMFLVARPRVIQRGVPSLPAMPRQDDGREHQYRSRLMMLSRAMADLAADANAFRSRKALPLSATQTVHGTDLHRGIVYTVP